MSSRLIALHAITRVLDKGQSLSAVRQYVYHKLEPRDRGLAMELVQGVLRWRWKLDAMLARCMDKPLRRKETELRYLLYMALYELSELQSPDYAVVDEAVKLSRKIRRSWASALVNAVLRRYIKQSVSIEQNLTAEQSLSHPQWLIDLIRTDWPDQWQQILSANNQPACICLRVNTMLLSREEYLAKLQQHDIDAEPHPINHTAVTLLQQIDVTQLPGYDAGEFAVQDAGAQLAAELFDAEQGQHVLDLCAAPGGKTCHILERASNDLSMLAIDNDAERMQRVTQNLQRMRVTADTLVADAASDDWYLPDERAEQFDAILLDAPCSASGVIRRHPDIKSLRRQEDIATLVTLQQKILESAWPQLKTGGRMLYATCSVLQAENSQQVQQFLIRHGDAVELPLNVDWGVDCSVGKQLLPGQHQTDGFYYALLIKHN